MSKASRDKGKRGERELAAALREYGVEARRGQQYSGANGDADVVGLDGYHIECKRCETLKIPEWLRQAERDCGDRIPLVCFRRSREDWYVVLRLKDFMEGICDGVDKR